MPNLCIFCGSRVGNDPVHAQTARRLGTAMVPRGWNLVYGGGHVGMMGILANAVRQAGGNVIGVIPRALMERELAHPELDDLRVVGDMHERKAMMSSLADAFLALPGGYGTLEELFEIVTWAQLKFHSKPIAILNTKGYFTPLLAWIDHAIAEGFIQAKYRDLLLVEEEMENVLARLESQARP